MDSGDTAWMLVSSALVMLMTPGLALFYGGLARSKNVLGTIMQSFFMLGIISLQFVIIGFSLAFGPDQGGLIGNFDWAFLRHVTASEPSPYAATIPASAYMIFQLMFAVITPALITGAFAERAKFSTFVVFMLLWATLVYDPVAHWVWSLGGWLGSFPEANGDVGLKAIDFAGGTVVHVNAGIAGLVAAIMLGRRVGFGREAFTPHSMTMTMIGASLLWVGWFGFNVGSNLEATGLAAMAFINTFVATAMAAISWMLAEWIFRGKPSMLGAASGAVAGLVAITPACGFVGPVGAIIIGLVVSPLCYFFVAKVKSMFGYDDSLDVFGVHCIGGIFGAIATGIFVNPALGGTGVYDYVANAAAPYSSAQVVSQVWAVGTSLVWSAVVAAISLIIVRVVVGLRVSQDVEREGLDVNEHGEPAYHF